MGGHPGIGKHGLPLRQQGEKTARGQESEGEENRPPQNPVGRVLHPTDLMLHGTELNTDLKLSDQEQPTGSLLIILHVNASTEAVALPTSAYVL